MTTSFKTSPIPMSSDEFEAMAIYLEQLRVDQNGFANGVDIDRNQPIDGNRIHGEPILMDFDEENGTVVIHGNGTLIFSRIENFHGYLIMSPHIGHFINDILNEQFIENRSGISVTVEQLEDGVLDTVPKLNINSVIAH